MQSGIKKYLPAYLMVVGIKTCMCLIKINRNKYIELNLFSLNLLRIQIAKDVCPQYEKISRIGLIFKSAHFNIF